MHFPWKKPFSGNRLGILAARFRVFEKPMLYSPEKVVKIIRTCYALHNWLRQTILQNQQYEYTVGTENYKAETIVAGNWRNEP